MWRRVVHLAFALGMAAYAFTARAEFFSFTFEDTTSTIVASGEITTGAPFVGGLAPVVAISGVFDGFPITGLLPNNTGKFSTNNLLHETAPFVDSLGIIFGASTPTDSIVANIFEASPGVEEIGACTQTVINAGRCFEGSPSLLVLLGTFAVAPVVAAAPEPATLTLLIGALLMLIAMSYRYAGTRPR
jgi:hypothetical protein